MSIAPAVLRKFRREGEDRPVMKEGDVRIVELGHKMRNDVASEISERIGGEVRWAVVIHS
jgi:hypothetical protein